MLVTAYNHNSPAITGFLLFSGPLYVELPALYVEPLPLYVEPSALCVKLMSLSGGGEHIEGILGMVSQLGRGVGVVVSRGAGLWR